MENQLKNEKSPYLKQHKDNPVNWLPWKKEILEKAKNEKKPIFLSVGYASCHWCHVMAHESFENNKTAKIMNEKFINIKVDREERPDLDFIFQKSLAILTGAQGGWPLSMFLDENAVPFTGGTYFPPKELHGRPSFNNVLENVSKVYQENRDKILNQANQMRIVFKELNKKNAVLKQDLEPYVEKIINYMDEVNGGFKGAPKFPQFYIFDAILHFYKKTKNKKYLEIVEKLLLSISSKGIYDHLEGGISRYTVDEKWIVPHFEKMLYDNIQYVNLLNNYLNQKENNYLKEKLQQTISFVNSEFITKNNLLGSAYDADSDGVEGKYYVWKFKELNDLLGNNSELFKKKYQISEQGNFEGSNILVENLEVNFNENDNKKILELKKNLLKVRKKRSKPFFDDKTQTDLNSFWIYVNFYSSILLNDKDLFQKSITNFDNLSKLCKNKIFHCYDDNKDIDVFLEDYVYYCLLLLTIYEFKNDKSSLKKCEILMSEAWNSFFNSNEKILQKNKIQFNDLFVEPIDLNDNNIPNGNSIYLFICNKLFNISGNQKWNEKIDILSKSFHSHINSNFLQMFSYIKILDICDENITVSINSKNPQTSIKVKKLAIKNFMDKATIIYKEDNEEDYFIICKKQTCSPKLRNLDEVEHYLKNLL
tara:strand:+ start:130 stop:2079 length:1950 start_codon:yes stop_codon:yes gene_type:complete